MRCRLETGLFVAVTAVCMRLIVDAGVHASPLRLTRLDLDHHHPPTTDTPQPWLCYKNGFRHERAHNARHAHEQLPQPNAL